MYSSIASGNSLAPLWLPGGTVWWITPWKLIGKPNSKKSIASWSWKPLVKSRTTATFMAVLTGTLHPLKFGKPDDFTRACNWMLLCTSGPYFMGILGLGWNSSAWGFRLRVLPLTGSTTPGWAWHSFNSHSLSSSPTSPQVWPPVKPEATEDPSATSNSTPRYTPSCHLPLLPPVSSVLRSFSPIPHICTGVKHSTIWTHPLASWHSCPPSDSTSMFLWHGPSTIRPSHEATALRYSASFWTSTASHSHVNMEVGRTWVLCMGLCVLSHDLCGQLGDLSGWLRSAPSFWKHFAHMCLTLTSLPRMFFVWGADWSHEPDWKSLHHHTIFLSSPPTRCACIGWPPPFPPVFFPLVLGCLRPNLDDQSTFPGFSNTIFSTCSKFESQVEIPVSILAKIAACKCSNFDHSTYCALYAIVFNICSLRCASFRFILPPW